MSFKEFYNDYKLFEATGDTGVSDAFEGILSLCVGVYLLKSSVQTQEIQKLRRKVLLKSDGPTIINLQRYIDIESRDFNVPVMVSLSLKQNAYQYFGPNITSSRADDLVATLCNKVGEIDFFNKIISYIDEVKKHPEYKAEISTIWVMAKGKDLAAQKDIKGDISITIRVTQNNGEEKDYIKPLTFSLKTSASSKVSQDVTIANNSAYNSFLRLGQVFHLPFVAGYSKSHFPPINTIIKITGPGEVDVDPEILSKKDDPNHIAYYVYKCAEEYSKPELRQSNLQNLIDNAIIHFERQLSNKDFKTLTNDTFTLLKKELFGSDADRVIHLHAEQGIKEITKEYLDFIQSNIKEIKFNKTRTGKEEFLYFNAIDMSGKSHVLFKIRINISGTAPKFFMQITDAIYDFVPAYKAKLTGQKQPS